MTSKYRIPKEEKIGEVVRCLSEKGSIAVLHCLEEGGTVRFSEIRRRVGRLSTRTLAKRLKQLEGIKLINRRVYAEVPPRVEYSLTEHGEKLASILSQVWKMFEEWYS